MKHKKQGYFLLLALVLGLFTLAPPGAAQTSPITFEESQVINYFPNRLTFIAAASSTAGDIVSAKLIYKFRNATSATQVVLDVVTGPKAVLTYDWDTSQITVPPSAPIFYHWEAVDSEGNRGTSEEMLITYDDVRFDWQIREGDNFAVWWHDQPDELGDMVFRITKLALRDQSKLFQAGLDFPIRIIIYNNDAEFAEWHSFVSEFIGGQAFPSMGITTQIISSYSSQHVWINEVIPHEISHLFFYQATYSPFTSPPAWLNEGVAQLNEVADHRFIEAYTREMIRAGNLIPLTALTGSFGYEEEEVRLAYAEGLSAASFLVEAYGEEGMGRLLAAYKEGMGDEEAFIEAFGLNVGDFEQEWLRWIDVPEGVYGTPTPQPTIELPPMPTMVGYPTSVPSATSEALEAKDTSTPPAQIQEAPRTAIAQAEVASPTDAQGAETAPRPSVCNPGAMLLIIFLLPLGIMVRTKKPKR